MDFHFTEEQTMIADSLRAVLAKTCRPADLRRLLEEEAGTDTERRMALDALGLAGALVSGEKGGLGLEPVDFVLLAEACGHACLPEPLVHSAGVAVPFYARFAEPDDPLLRAALESGASLALQARKSALVPRADEAEAVMVIAEGGVSLAAPSDLGLHLRRSMDPFRRLFSIGDLPASARRLATLDDAAGALDAAFERGTVFAAAELVGIAQRAIDMAVEYSREREQFGRPIGANQAVKHLLAEAQVRVEFARPVIYAAAAELPRADGASRARASHAFLAACEAADMATRRAIQVHGAMGYSWEVDVHFFLKRALGLSGDWGGVRFHRARYGDHALSAPLGPAHTFAREAPDA